MPRAWLTYAWKDNAGPNADDVDFLIQEIGKQGIELRFDRRDLVVGQLLWPQIEKHILDPKESDALVFLVTAQSLSSKPCQEELLYALQRVLDKRTSGFPLIGLVHGAVPGDLPAALNVRLWVSTDERDWSSRVADGVRGQAPTATSRNIQPFAHHFCNSALGGGDHALEVHPRVGSWGPFCFGLARKDADKYSGGTYAPPGCMDQHQSAYITSPLEDWEEDGWVWRGVRSPAVSPSMGAHIFLRLAGKPLTIKFGQRGGNIYTVDLQP